MPILIDPDTQPLPWGGLTTLSTLLMKPGPLGFLLPPLHASPLSSLQILIWEPMGATKPQPTNATSSFSLEPRVHLVLPCLKAFSLPPLIVPSKGSGPAWPLECPPSQPLPGPVSRVEMSNAAGGEISKSTSLPPTSWL